MAKVRLYFLELGTSSSSTFSWFFPAPTVCDNRKQRQGWKVHSHEVPATELQDLSLVPRTHLKKAACGSACLLAQCKGWGQVEPWGLQVLSVEFQASSEIVSGKKGDSA